MICVAIVIINLSTLPWNKHDQEVLDRNKNFCELRLPHAPCISKFIKKGENNYHIWCKK